MENQKIRQTSCSQWAVRQKWLSKWQMIRLFIVLKADRAGDLKRAKIENIE